MGTNLLFFVLDVSIAGIREYVVVNKKSQESKRDQKLSEAFCRWVGHLVCRQLDLRNRAEVFISETEGIVDHGCRDVEWYMVAFHQSSKKKK